MLQLGKYTHAHIIAMENLMEKIKVEVKEVKNLMESQDARKAPGPDGVSNWIMKECSNQLAGKLHCIIESSLKESWQVEQCGV